MKNRFLNIIEALDIFLFALITMGGSKRKENEEAFERQFGKATAVNDHWALE